MEHPHIDGPIVCHRCKGLGTVEHHLGKKYSSGGEKCPECDGQGMSSVVRKQLEICDTAAAAIEAEVMRDYDKVINGKCDCYSSEWEIGSEPAKVLDMSKYFPYLERHTVSVDACIAEQVELLWLHGIETKGSCCGHNRAKASIVLGSVRDAGKAALALEGWDIELKAWALINC